MNVDRERLTIKMIHLIYLSKKAQLVSCKLKFLIPFTIAVILFEFFKKRVTSAIDRYHSFCIIPVISSRSILLRKFSCTAWIYWVLVNYPSLMCYSMNSMITSSVPDDEAISSDCDDLNKKQGVQEKKRSFNPFVLLTIPSCRLVKEWSETESFPFLLSKALFCELLIYLKD